MKDVINITLKATVEDSTARITMEGVTDLQGGTHLEQVLIAGAVTNILEATLSNLLTGLEGKSEMTATTKLDLDTTEW